MVLEPPATMSGRHHHRRQHRRSRSPWPTRAGSTRATTSRPSPARRTGSRRTSGGGTGGRSRARTAGGGSSSATGAILAAAVGTGTRPSCARGTTPSGCRSSEPVCLDLARRGRAEVGQRHRSANHQPHSTTPLALWSSTPTPASNSGPPPFPLAPLLPPSSEALELRSQLDRLEGLLGQLTDRQGPPSGASQPIPSSASLSRLLNTSVVSPPDRLAETYARLVNLLPSARELHTHLLFFHAHVHYLMPIIHMPTLLMRAATFDRSPAAAASSSRRDFPTLALLLAAGGLARTAQGTMAEYAGALAGYTGGAQLGARGGESSPAWGKVGDSNKAAMALLDGAAEALELSSSVPLPPRARTSATFADGPIMQVHGEADRGRGPRAYPVLGLSSVRPIDSGLAPPLPSSHPGSCPRPEPGPGARARAQRRHYRPGPTPGVGDAEHVGSQPAAWPGDGRRGHRIRCRAASQRQRRGHRPGRREGRAQRPDHGHRRHALAGQLSCGPDCLSVSPLRASCFSR